jgi:hypothetical protein
VQLDGKVANNSGPRLESKLGKAVTSLVAFDLTAPPAITYKLLGNGISACYLITKWLSPIEEHEHHKDRGY